MSMFSIAIDGPAGAGKSSVAKALAARLKFVYVDTGALYRTVALHLISNKVDIGDQQAVEAALSAISVGMEHMEDGQHVLLCGRDVTGEIRSNQVSMAASSASALPVVRSFLFKLQTDMAQKYNVIMDGRDIGTVVLPKAQVKIFLTASTQVRAGRRVLEMEQKGEKPDYSEILETIKQRDYQDENRPVAPLKPAEDAVILDSSDMSFEMVIDKIEKLVNEKRAGE